MRSPAKKALLAADVPPGAYGRAFGFERLMDTVGAIAGPLTALWLLEQTRQSYRQVFLWTLVPGLTAVVVFWLLVRERPVETRPQRSFVVGIEVAASSLSAIFGGGWSIRRGRFFAHDVDSVCVARADAGTRLARAASIAVGLYTLHNVFYAGSAYVSGWISDHVRERKYVLAAGYGLAFVTAILLCTKTQSLVLLAVIARLRDFTLEPKRRWRIRSRRNWCRRISMGWRLGRWRR